MITQKLRWGLLSTARINRKLIPALRASNSSDLVAVASRSAQKAQEYAAQWKIPNALASYEDLLANPQVDVIYNSLPNRLHAEWTIKALRAGKHVLCEKPLALSVAEVDAIAAAASETGRVVAEAFMYRHIAQTFKVQELVSSGILGQVKLIRGSFSFLLEHPQDVRLQKDLGGGSLWDVGCYPVSYTHMLTGCAPTHVYGRQILTPGDVDETFAGEMVYPNGIIAQFDSSFTLDTYTYMEIRGNKGTLIIPFPFNPQAKTQITLRQGHSEKYYKFPAINLYQGEVEDMANAIFNGAPSRVSLQESRENIATLVNLLESAGQP